MSSVMHRISPYGDISPNRDKRATKYWKLLLDQTIKVVAVQPERALKLGLR
jgi:hypothetical protein